MPFKLVLFIFVTGLLCRASTASAAICPLGRKDTELTIQRLMINFGRDTVAALTLARKGLNTPESVTDSDFKTTIEAIDSAQVCAQAAIAATSGALLPAKANQRTGTDRDDYVGRFHALMAEFNEALAGLVTALKLQQAAAPSARDYNQLIAKEKELETLATRAHHEL